MALIDESREAFHELRAVMPATIVFNGMSRSGVSHSITAKRMLHLQGYQLEASSEFEMEDTDYAAFVTAGLTEKVSKVSVDGGDELIIIGSDTHPNSATRHLFLKAAG